MEIAASILQMDKKKPYIFIDRDDTLIYDVPYLNDPEKARLTPGAGRTLAMLREKGFGIIVISNQSGVGRGIITMEQLNAVFARIKEMLLAEGCVLDDIFFCPHTPADNCKCRKPRTGMLEQACAKHAVDLQRSAMVGDSKADIEMGRAFKLRTVQIRLPGLNKADANADFTADSLENAYGYLCGLLEGK